MSALPIGKHALHGFHRRDHVIVIQLSSFAGAASVADPLRLTSVTLATDLLYTMVAVSCAQTADTVLSCKLAVHTCTHANSMQTMLVRLVLVQQILLDCFMCKTLIPLPA